MTKSKALLCATAFSACLALPAQLAFAQDGGPTVDAISAAAPATTTDAAPPPAAKLDAAPAKAASKAEPAAAEEGAEEFGFSDLFGILKDAVAEGNWTLAVLAVLMLLVLGVRFAAGKFGFLEWFKSRWGGWTLNFLTTSLGLLLATYGSGSSLSWSLISDAIVLGLGAAGGYELFRDLFKEKK